MVKNIKTKKAVAMIELIFALVVMGIALMSAPMLIHQSIKSSNVALQQEAIVAAASQTAIILSTHWDEENSNVPAGESPILNANRAAFNFPPAGLTDVFGRTSDDGGNILEPSAHIGADANELVYTDFDDVDDYDGSNFGLMLYNAENTTVNAGEYADTNITIATTVAYTQEGAVTTNTIGGVVSNIKLITVNLTSNQVDVPELAKDITMQAFSCNIGTYAIYGAEY